MQSKTVNATSETDQVAVQVPDDQMPRNDFRLLEEDDDKGHSLNVEMEYIAHSQLYDIINTGIELDLILNDANDRTSQERLKRVRQKMQND